MFISLLLMTQCFLTGQNCLHLTETNAAEVRFSFRNEQYLSVPRYTEFSYIFTFLLKQLFAKLHHAMLI
jgi:hypothetical protein